MDESRLCRGCLHTYTVTGGDNLDRRNWTIHPGMTWREILEHKQVTQAEAARDLGITQQFLSNILCGSRLPKVDLTVRFARWAGVEPRFMWQLVSNYKLDLALGKRDTTRD